MADAVVSPLARAIRLGAEIRRLRKQAGLSQIQLAGRAGLPRTDLLRVETPASEPQRRTNPTHARAAVLALVDEDSPQYRELERLIWDAAAAGWWERQRRMGAGQRVVAAIECGATIREYHNALIPGLLQTEAYARYRAQVGASPGDDLDAIVDGRMRRQQAAANTRYQVVLEEAALRRLAAPADVMVDQLHHLTALADRPDVSVRVLPLDARLDAGWSPTLPFAIYDYPDPADPTIVLIDVVGRAPSPMAEPDETRLFVQLHDRLVDAALSDVDSAACIKDAAGRLAGR